MTRRRAKRQVRSVAARRALVKEWEKAPDKSAFARAHGLHPPVMYRMRKAIAKEDASAASIMKEGGWTDATAAKVTADAAVNKLRKDNELLRQLVRRAMANGFLRDLFE